MERINESTNQRISESTTEFAITLGGWAGFVYSFIRLFVIFLFPIAFAAQSGAQEGVINRDSLAVLLAEVPVDTLVAKLGDSLFSPPEGKARILRDAYGVPHIYGRTDEDVAFGFGYAQAEDHLLQMLKSFRQARGRLAEVEGTSALKLDEMALRWRIHSVAGERYGDISEETRQYIAAFVEGINHYIEIHRQVLPQWVQDVRAVDVVALVQWILFLFAEQTGESELARVGLTTSVPKLPGSNLWVAGPSRSGSGAPVLAMDVQLPYTTPFQLCEAHLVSNAGLNVMGTTFFGLPVIFAGHNDHIAWSITTNDTDVFDLYEERLDPINPRRYFYGDEKRRVVSRRVKIHTEEGMREVEREFFYTDHGPVYKTIGNWAYAARTSVADRVDAMGQLLAMNRAVSLGAFQQALSHLELPVFNVIYGDVMGEIFYVFNGRCPVRSEDFDWRAPVPGWMPETEWRGMIAFSQLPQVHNPTSGSLQNCNVSPDVVAIDSGLKRDDFPPFLGWGRPNYRAQRIVNWLLTHQNIAVGDMQALLRDDYLVDAEESKGLIYRAYNRAWPVLYDPNWEIGKAVQILRSWDNRASLESVGTLLFSIWKMRFDPLLAQAPQKRDIIVREKVALEALQQAVAYMITTYGRLDVPWGQVHYLKRGDRTFPMSGAPSGTEALHQTMTRIEADGTMLIEGGSAFGMVVSLVQPVQSWSALAYGNSENTESPHYDDQAELQHRNTFKKTVFTTGDLQPVLTDLTTVPYDPEEAERQSLKAIWHKQLQTGEVAPDSTDTGPESSRDD
ncbi:MAG: penicillin acylase family protein [Gemmatimonadetes bacterium]|nr:penicillin acylase family protein [Gemmatimonadota bacterium]